MSIYAELIKLRRVIPTWFSNYLLNLSKFSQFIAFPSFKFNGHWLLLQFPNITLSRQVFHQITLKINSHRRFLEAKINHRYLTLLLRAATFFILDYSSWNYSNDKLNLTCPISLSSVLRPQLTFFCFTR